MISFIVGALTGCIAGGVKRADIDTEVALTDRWNDKDSQIVAGKMVADLLVFPWIRDYQQKNPGKRPTIIIQRIRNKSHEHIPIETFLNDLKRTLIRSGQVDFVAGGAERDDARLEQIDQEKFASQDTQAEIGQETGATFALSGTITSIVDELGGTRVVFYQVDLKLIDLETKREVWNGQEKIKKVRKRGFF